MPFIGFFIIIVVYLLYTSYAYSESFTVNSIVQPNSKERNVILLGDSILKNNHYVKPVNSIEYILRQQTNNQVHCLATDGASIEDVYTQIDEVPTTLNNKQTIIFLSIGGNDNLKYMNKHKNAETDILFQQYERLLSDLQIKFDKCKIVLLNLYTPPNINKLIKNDTITDVIKAWNNKLDGYLNNNNLNIHNVELIDINSLLYEKSDFVSDYEPSEVGGHKIVTAILNKL